MKRHIIKSLAALALGAMLLVSCDPDDMFNINDTVPQQPVDEPFSLSATAWISVIDEWWTSSMHVIDTSIWRFITDSTGTIYEHRIYNDDDPYGGNTYPMTYTFDIATMKGIVIGYTDRWSLPTIPRIRLSPMVSTAPLHTIRWRNCKRKNELKSVFADALFLCLEKYIVRDVNYPEGPSPATGHRPPAPPKSPLFRTKTAILSILTI